MEWIKFIACIVIAFYLSFVPIATYYCYKTHLYCKRYMEGMETISTEIIKTNEAFRDKNTVFEATGYSTLITEKGNVKITFKKDIGDEHMAYTREVELPAWMWNNTVIEATSKLTLEALEKAKK